MTMLQVGPTLPSLPGLHWRILAPTDGPAIAALTERCQRSDGGLSIAAGEDYIQQHYLHTQGEAIGAFDLDERLVACAAVQASETAGQRTATIVGQVHPRYRGRGIGRFLLDWSLAEAQEFAGDNFNAPIVKITTELLTEPAARLYQRYGFAQEMSEDVMRFDLDAPIPPAALPDGVTLQAWTPKLAPAFFAVYRAAFRERPGFPDWSAERWIEWVSGGAEFCPAASWLARAGDRDIAFIVCDQDWITQVGVDPSRRGAGLGAALVVAALDHFRAAGSASVMLDVNVNNPGAASVYRRLGFTTIGRRARYVRSRG